MTPRSSRRPAGPGGPTKLRRAIAKSYERGNITRAAAQSHFTPEDRIFDEHGRMVPYHELKGLTRERFDEWRGNGPYPGEVREAIQSANAAVRKAGYPGC